MTTANRSRAEGVIVVAVGYLLVRAFWMVSGPAGRAFESATIEATAKLILWAGGCFPVALWLARRAGRSVAETVGLDRGAVRGLALGLVCTLPMVAALLISPRRPLDLDLTFGSGVLGPFVEELLFRGFLFGLLWRVAGWSLPASILVSSVLFGLAHVPNADLDLFYMLRGPGVDGFATDGRAVVVQVIPGTTIWWQFVSYRGPAILEAALPLAAGGAVLAWVAWRWNSLWPAIGLHGCMNLWWDLTRTEHVRPSLGPDIMSMAQLLSVALAVALTVRFGTSTASDALPSSSVRNELTLANER